MPTEKQKKAVNNIVDNQRKNNEVPDNLKPYCWKKGQSGNPEGRPKGQTLKEYCRDFLATQTPEERAEFLEGIPKESIWKMAEGNPANATDLTTGGESINIIIDNEIANKNGITSQDTK